MAGLEPTELSPPPALEHFKSPLLRFIAIGKYATALTGEKDKVIAVMKSKLIVAAIRGTLTTEVDLGSVVAMHRQVSLDEQWTNVVITTRDLHTTSFSIPERQAAQFFAVAQYYCPKSAMVHEVTPSAIPISQSVAGVSVSPVSSLLAYVQHVGQSDLERDEKVRAAKKDIASVRPAVAAEGATVENVKSGAPVVRPVAGRSTEVERLLDQRGDSGGEVTSPSLRPVQPITAGGGPRPLPSDPLDAEAYVSDVDPLNILGESPMPHISSPDDPRTSPRPALGGILAARSTTLVQESRTLGPALDGLPSRRGGNQAIASPRGGIANRQVEQLLKEMQEMRRELTSIRAQSSGQLEAQIIPPRPSVVDSDTDEPAGIPIGQAMNGSTQIAAMPGAAAGIPQPPPPTKPDAGEMLLPLLSQATQQAAVHALQELQESLRAMQEGSEKNINPHVRQAISSMTSPLQTLHRLLAPKRLLGVGDGRSRHPVLPVWVLVDFGEVNYNVLPLALKQYHRLMAQKVDDVDEPHIIFATRQQFATDDGYQQIALHSVVNVVMGGVPRPYRAQRLSMDGTILRSDEFIDSKSVLSIRTLVQTIVVQFEAEFECKQWHALIKEFVQQRPVDHQDL